MRVIYRQRSVIEVCEIVLNRMLANERENVEFIVKEEENIIQTKEKTYKKEELIWP